MQKINKSEILATVYQQEIDELNTKNEAHPKYYSGHKYYKSVLLSLLFCQNGLCAYTELRLIEIADLEKYKTQIKEQNGEFSREINFETPAQIEHFDESLKQEKAWEWSNLFAVFDSVNTKVKGTKSVDSILKPDSAEYNPFEMLEYNIENHVFTAHSDLAENMASRVENMIKTSGLNWKFIRNQRRAYLEELLEKCQNGLKIKPHQFITAFEMSKSELEES